MNKKWVPLLLIIILGIVLLFVKKFQASNTTDKPSSSKPSASKPKSSSDPAGSTDRNRGFDRRVSYIEYTQHAKCRMQCRKITQAEVEEIMRDGKINYNKSDVNDRPCPTYALEGLTSDDQKVRIVFAQCDLKTKVVTCIDLNTDWQCDCPGDDKKHQNNR